MTFSKTLLYWLQEYYCGWCATGHNDLVMWIQLFLIPNVYVVTFHGTSLSATNPHPTRLWIFCPAMIVFTLGKDIATALVATERAATKAALHKKN